MFNVKISRNKWIRYLELLGLADAWACVTYINYCLICSFLENRPYLLIEPNWLIAIPELIAGIIGFIVMVKKLSEWR